MQDLSYLQHHLDQDPRSARYRYEFYLILLQSHNNYQRILVVLENTIFISLNYCLDGNVCYLDDIMLHIATLGSLCNGKSCGSCSSTKGLVGTKMFS